MQIQPIDITQIIVAIITTAGVVYSARQQRKQQEKQKPEAVPQKTSTWTIVMCIGLILLAANLGVFGLRYWGTSEPMPIISEPSVKMHIFNGDRNDAENKARQTNIPITDIPRNVMGTDENLPAFVAYLSSQDIPSEGIIRVSGTYEIHADDFGGGPPSAFIVSMKDNEVVKEVKIETEPKLKEPIDFETKIRYRLDQVDRVEIHVVHAGSWGFFLSLIKFEACKS
jgi:hypothetical protein